MSLTRGGNIIGGVHLHRNCGCTKSAARPVCDDGRWHWRRLGRPHSLQTATRYSASNYSSPPNRTSISVSHRNGLHLFTIYKITIDTFWHFNRHINLSWRSTCLLYTSPSPRDS